MSTTESTQKSSDSKQVTADVATNKGLDLILESSLTPQLQQLATTIYTTARTCIEGLLSNTSLDASLKLPLVLSELVRQVESTSNNTDYSVSDKKDVVRELGKVFVKEFEKNPKTQAQVLKA